MEKLTKPDTDCQNVSNRPHLLG